MIYMLSSINKINLKKLKDPFLIYKPKILKQSVNYFKKNFSGEALYAVKANHTKFVLKKVSSQILQAYFLSRNLNL